MAPTLSVRCPTRLYRRTADRDAYCLDQITGRYLEMLIDPAGLNGLESHRLLISLIVPRPIAWVTSVSPEGVVNAAPYSFFSGVRSKPPVISISAGRGRHGEKDTPRNIAATGE